MCQRFPWRGGACPGRAVLHLAQRRTAITQRCAPASCISARKTPATRISATASNCFPIGSPPRRTGPQQFRHGASASNKPHLAEKRTAVWLAIWRTWAGFANSQPRRATFRITYLHICTHPHCTYVGMLLRHSKSFGPSAPIAYATSASPPDEAVAWLGTQVLGVR